VFGKLLSLKRSAPSDISKSMGPEESLEVLYPTVASKLPEFETPSHFQLAQRLISSYRVRASVVNHEIVEGMSRAGAIFLRNHRAKLASSEENDHLKQSLHEVLDRSFAVMEPYVDELNYRLGANEFRISCTAPAWVTESMGQHLANRTFYRARVSTCVLSVVMRAAENKVEFFVLPTSQIMALSAIEDRHRPLMQFTATANGAFIDWEVEGKPLTADRLERYCLLLFNYLLDQTKTEMAASA
jgi:hypothetical protein